MTDKEKAIRWFEDIADECDKLTSGNVAHLRAQIKGMAIRSAEYLAKHKQEQVSEDLRKAEIDWLRPQLDKSYANYGETKMMELTHFDGYAMLDAIEFGAQWQKEQMMKDAAEGQFDYNHIIVPYSELARVFPNGKDGDKVKVIIIKE